MPNSAKQPFPFWRFFVSLKGRLTRAPFIVFMLPMKLIATAMLITQYTDLSLIRALSFGLIVFQLVFVWPQYAVVVKRLHDIGRSSFFALHIPVYMVAWLAYLIFFYYYSRRQPLNLLPYVAYNLLQNITLLYGYLLFVVLAIVPGHKGLNHYGSPPHRSAQSISEVF